MADMTILRLASRMVAKRTSVLDMLYMDYSHETRWRIADEVAGRVDMGVDILVSDEIELFIKPAGER